MTMWRLQPFKDSAPKFFFYEPPCLFHRLMQRWFFGFKWIKEDVEQW